MELVDAVAKAAAWDVATYFGCGDDVSAVGHLANVICHHLRRHAHAAGGAIADLWPGRWNGVGPTYDEAAMVARASLGSCSGTISAALHVTLVQLPKDKGFRFALPTFRADVQAVCAFVDKHIAAVGAACADLQKVNAHRRSAGLPLLEPIAAGWKAEDIRLEAERISG